MSEDMSPYCSAHDEWLIMKLCMYVGYHDANNVSKFGGDPVNQFNLKKPFYSTSCCVYSLTGVDLDCDYLHTPSLCER